MADGGDVTDLQGRKGCVGVLFVLKGKAKGFKDGLTAGHVGWTDG